MKKLQYRNHDTVTLQIGDAFGNMLRRDLLRDGQLRSSRDTMHSDYRTENNFELNRLRNDFDLINSAQGEKKKI